MSTAAFTAHPGRNLLVSLLLLAWTAASLVLAVAALLADRHYALDLLAQFAAPALVLAALGALAAAAAFRPAAAAANLLALAGLLVAMQPQLRPATPPPASAAAAAAVRVLFNNAWVRNPEPERLAAAVAAEDADVVALVEVGPRHLRALEPVLRRYPHRIVSVAGRFRGRDPRILIASRHPLTLRASERRDGLAVTEVDVAAPGLPFRLVASHLTRPWPFDRPQAQHRQAERLARRILAGEPRRTLLVGDFNAVPAGAVLRRFAERTSLIPAPAPLGTWPSAVPAPLRIGIDNAFAGPELSLAARRVGPDTGSDHRPVLLTLRPALRAIPGS